jgi:hypothetical protein
LPELDIPIAQNPDVPMARSGVSEISGGWRLATDAKRVFRLFEISTVDMDLGRCALIYRAELRPRRVKDRAYLELWCHIPGSGLYFAKGLHRAVTGIRSWRVYEIQFQLEAGQRPDWIGLNVTFDGPGTLEVRNVKLARRAIPGFSNSRQAIQTATTLLWRLTKLVVLGAMNAVLVAGQLALIILPGLLGLEIFSPEKMFTWWPKKKGPTIGKMAG